MRYSFFMVVLFAANFFSSEVSGQTPETPVEYMQYLSSRDQEMAAKYLSYMSEVAHGHRARKMERRRQDLLAEIKQSLGEANRLKPYKGDVALRDAFRNYWDILYKVFNEDYHKIVNMEEIAEQSYDAMEAYLLAQEKAGEVLRDAREQVEPVYNNFAAKNNVRIIETESKMNNKLQTVAQVTRHQSQIFLIYFKSFKQEVYMLDAFNKKDINGTEQNRITLVKFAEEGLAKLDTLTPYKNDRSMINACRKVLEFHKSEAVNSMPKQTDFMVKASEFDKIKKAMDATPPSKRTQADVDTYNKAVKDMNAAITTSNTVLVADNNARDKVLKNYTDTEQQFLDKHVPKGK